MAILTTSADKSAASPSLPQASGAALRRLVFGFLGAGVAALIAIMCLPADRAARFHLLRDTDYLKAGWIYDRIVVSKTPIDVAVIGTSHTMNGVDSVLLEQGLNDGGGPGLHVVNLALPHFGDDMHDLIARLLIAAKKPRVLVIELLPLEARAAHPAFGELADVGDLISAPWGNPEQFAAWARLPRRQVRNFLATMTDESGPSDIADHWNDTYYAMGRGGTKSPPRTTALAQPRLIREAAKARESLHQKAQSYAGNLGWLMWHYNETYLVSMIEHAKKNDVPVVFLYMPGFGTPEPAVPSALPAAYGRILTPPAELLTDPTVWFDPEHLNYEGSKRLTFWLAGQLREMPPLSGYAATTAHGR